MNAPTPPPPPSKDDEQAKREKKLIDEIADWLAEEGYPWTANQLRDGSWRKGRR